MSSEYNTRRMRFALVLINEGWSKSVSEALIEGEHRMNKAATKDGGDARRWCNRADHIAGEILVDASRELTRRYKEKILS